MPAALLCVLQAGCQFSQPGERGTRFADEAEQLSGYFERTINAPLPSPLACDEAHDLRVEASQRGPCEAVDRGQLYAEAVRRLQSRLATLECTRDECPVRDAFVISQKIGCRDALTEARIDTRVRCIGADLTPEPGLDEPTPTERRDGIDERLGGYQPPATASEHLESELWQREENEFCPTTLYFTALTRQVVPDCAAVSDYTPFVDLTRALADEVGAATACPADCRPRPWREHWLRWQCFAPMSWVIVTLEFTVECAKRG